MVTPLSKHQNGYAMRSDIDRSQNKGRTKQQDSSHVHQVLHTRDPGHSNKRQSVDLNCSEYTDQYQEIYHLYQDKGHRKDYYEMLTSVVRSKFATLLLTIAEEEESIEQQRQYLASFQAFEPYSAFSRIDRENKGFICGKEVQEFLADNGYDHLLESECSYIVHYFDSNPSEHRYKKLDYQE